MGRESLASWRALRRPHNPQGTGIGTNGCWAWRGLSMNRVTQSLRVALWLTSPGPGVTAIRSEAS